jgi:hypothetical protein
VAEENIHALETNLFLDKYNNRTIF